MAPKRRVHLAQVLPLWTPASSAATNLAFMSLLLRLGITDVEGYFRKLFVAIYLAVYVAAWAVILFILGWLLSGLIG